MPLELLPLDPALSFGARVRGVTLDLLADEAARRRLVAAFEDRGLLLFEDVEPSSRMHVAISDVFGPMKEHPVANVTRVDADTLPGVIDMHYKPGMGNVVEIDGRRLTSWLPWHFDHCYNNELNRAGVLRALIVAPDGGRTCFADGVALFQALPPDLRAAIEGRRILYTLDLLYEHMRFGLPDNVRPVYTPPSEHETLAIARTLPRAVHPAVWTRDDGRRVLHVSPWMAVGIEGDETPAGDALLRRLCDEINARAQSYCHQWRTTDMLIWDNWRMLHAVDGTDPGNERRMQRTTIKGDYGLGCFEGGGAGHALLERTV